MGCWARLAATSERINEVDIMKGMNWIPDEERDRKVNQYLEKINHAPYELIFAVLLGIFCFITFIVLLGGF